MRTAWIAAIAVASGGCASRVELTVRTEPAGALVTEVGTGTSFGVAPATVVYQSQQLEQTPDGQGCYRVRGLQATWGSGAVTTLDPVRLCGSPSGSKLITIGRNPNAPGLQQDLDFALRLQDARSAHLARMRATMPPPRPAVPLTVTPTTPIPPPAPLPSQLENRPGMIGMGSLVRDYVSGFNRICVYKKTGGEVATTIASYEMCPRWIQ